MADLRIRGVDDSVIAALKRAAETSGRSLEAELRCRLQEFARSGIGEFPARTDWMRAGFDDAYELIPGYQYIASAGMDEYRITLIRSLTGGDPEWNTEIEESARIGEQVCWVRAVGVATRLRGATAAMAMRDCIRWVAEYAGVDAVSRARAVAARYENLPKSFQIIVDAVDEMLGDERTIHERNLVIWKTADHDVYINVVDEKRGAIMVYPHGDQWSVTNGKATYFPLGKRGIELIGLELERLSIT